MEINLQKEKQLQQHNTLNRQTMTTGENEFAPYSMSQIWYAPETVLDLYIVFDETRISFAKIKQCLEDIGAFGFERDASIGLGKFTLAENPQVVQFTTKNANACLTLANIAPQHLGLHKENSFYQLHNQGS